MARGRVLSFMSQWSIPIQSHGSHSRQPSDSNITPPSPSVQPHAVRGSFTPPAGRSTDNFGATSPSPTRRRNAPSRAGSRPTSMVQTFQPPLMEVAQDTPPELQPVFTFLNSHSNKLYQEGYFLKLHDLDSRGRPSADRQWQECFGQLVGTVLSLWDAGQLDSAGEDGEVVPTFINLADASIKMIESLPMNEHGGQALHNILSVSTAANNRYLFHFSSLNSLTQWTAGIRLAMFENSSLQEAYTGSLIAGKGKMLNNIRQIMDRNRMKYEDWARVRFGAGTPWRRCWFVVSPPDEKEYQKAQKAMKKASPYAKPPVLRGDLKFYETKKITKKTKPIATITDAFSAYAIYPQSKPLIDQSTLVKVEGRITIHSSPENSTDGFVFVMPEGHAAVTGFEMMLRFLFPVWDTFALYGRPARLIADVRDAKGLMFALPQDRRYGYLENLDVCGLIHTDGQHTWSERDWRKRMKDLTAKRMLTVDDDPENPSGGAKNNTSRISLPPSHNSRLRFDENASGRSTPSGTPEYRNQRRMDNSNIGADNMHNLRHRRSHSEAIGYKPTNPHRLSRAQDAYNDDVAPAPPPHRQGADADRSDTTSESSGKSSGEKTPDRVIPPEVEAFGQKSPPPAPVAAPPTMAHAPSQKPDPRPFPPQQLRRGHQELDPATLTQIEEVSSPGPSPFGGPLPQSSPERLQGSYPDRTTSRQGEHDQQGRQIQNYAPRNQFSPPRLATIPASPYVDQTVTPNSATTPTSYFQGMQAPGQQHEMRPPPPPQHGSSGMIRKPVPRSTSPTKAGHENSRPSTAASHINDRPYSSDLGTPSEEDFTDRPRMGKKKTVGSISAAPGAIVIGDAHYSQGPKAGPQADIPNVDFGPTYALNPAAKQGPALLHNRGYSSSSEDFSVKSASHPHQAPLPSPRGIGQHSSNPHLAAAAAATAAANAYQRSQSPQRPQRSPQRSPIPNYGSQSPQRPLYPNGALHQATSFESTRAPQYGSGRNTPNDAGRMVMYGGKWVPEQQGQQMKLRDYQMFGPEYVASMEQPNLNSNQQNFGPPRTPPGPGPAAQQERNTPSPRKWV